MAIGFDSAQLSQANSTTQNSWSHTVTGSNTYGLMGVAFAAGTDISGTPTWNGANMTQIATITPGGAVFDKGYLYGIVAPTTGNIVVNNTGGANYIYAASSSYTGVDQTHPNENPVNKGTASASANNIGVSLTTSVDNDWLAGFFYDCTAGNNLTAGTNTTLRVNSGNPWVTIGDTNAPQSPAGFYGITANASGSNLLACLVVALAPATAAANNGNFSGFFM